MMIADTYDGGFAEAEIREFVNHAGEIKELLRLGIPH
jgi:hypothetical protein